MECQFVVTPTHSPPLLLPHPVIPFPSPFAFPLLLPISSFPSSAIFSLFILSFLFHLFIRACNPFPSISFSFLAFFLPFTNFSHFPSRYISFLFRSCSPFPLISFPFLRFFFSSSLKSFPTAYVAVFSFPYYLPLPLFCLPPLSQFCCCC